MAEKIVEFPANEREFHHVMEVEKSVLPVDVFQCYPFNGTKN